MGVKISELVEKTTANSSDVIPVVDTGTKKMKLSTLLSLIFPIGSTYVTQTNTNPSTILGFGTWERLKGKVCLGLDEDDNDLKTIGNTGGEKTHTLTVTEMPSHNHLTKAAAVGTASSFADGFVGLTNSYSQDPNFSTANSGGGKAHNNMQPYQVVGYMWIRKS